MMTVLCSEGGQHEDRQAHAFGPQRLAYLQSAHPGQHQVQDQQGGLTRRMNSIIGDRRALR